MSARKKATVDYFPHYTNEGKTLSTIKMDYPARNCGYQFIFTMFEILGTSEQHFLDCNIINNWRFLLAKTQFDEEKTNKILHDLSDFGTIDNELWNLKIIWSENFVNNLSSLYNRRGINVYKKPDVLEYCLQKGYLDGNTVAKNPQSKVEEIKIEKNKVNKKIPPKNSGGDFIKELFDIFKEEYLKSRGFTYLGNKGKDNSHIAKLLQTLKDIYPKINSEEMKEVFRKKISCIMKIDCNDNKFIFEGMSPALIINQISKINTLIKNKTGQSQEVFKPEQVK